MTAVAEPQPEPNPDFPATEVRFGWLRHEHLHPDQPSPRPQPKHDMLIRNNFDSLRLAIDYLTKSFGDKYPKGGEYLRRLGEIENAVLETPAPLAPLAATFDTLLKEALLANPLIDFDSLVFIDRQGSLSPSAWLNLAAIRPTGHDNAVKVLSPVSPDGKVTTLFTPPDKAAIARMDLHFDGNKLLYSTNGKTPPDCWGAWQISEVDLPPELDPANGQPITREIDTIPDKDVENFDACYGADGSIYFTSTATQLGVPCIGGGAPIAQLYRKKPDGAVERLTVDQDHNWHPSLLPNGRIMYLRWDYTDTPHCFNRVIFSMNPDGTDQAAMYGSNSYWPNSTFYPRAVPGSSTKFVGIVSGHHDWGQIGHLVLFDTTQGRFEADGVVQQIPGYGKKVKPVMQDGLIGGLYPLFVTPYPLSDKYFLAGMKTNNPEGWGTDIYLVDVFDNALRLYGAPGRWMIEPLPLRKRPKPPAIPDRTIAGAKTATVLMAKAALRKPSNITPWHGPMRGFSFNREVQPVLDKHCVGCHHGGTLLTGRDGGKVADLTLRPDEVAILKSGVADPAAHFPPAYYQLMRFVRNATLESDLHMLVPYDVHADQTRLVQLLKKGHHGVNLDAEGWDRMITWIDMNIPAHGSWKDIVGSKLADPVHARRKDLMQRYAHVDFDPEDIGAFVMDASRPKITPVMPAAQPQRPASIRATHPLQVDTSPATWQCLCPAGSPSRTSTMVFRCQHPSATTCLTKPVSTT
jgi:hypothetical protein